MKSVYNSQDCSHRDRMEELCESSGLIARVELSYEALICIHAFTHSYSLSRPPL